MFTHSSVDRHLGCFYLLVTMNNAAMDMGIQISVQIPAFISLGYISRSRYVGSYNNSMFNFLRNCNTLFHSGCTIYIPTSNVHGFQFLYILISTCYFLFYFFIIVILMCMQWYLIMVLICIFQSFSFI